MSVSAAIQKLIVNRLKAHAGVTALVAGRVYDRAPLDAAFPYISLGPTDAVRVPGDCKTLRDVTVRVDSIRVFPDQDPAVTHGVVTVTAQVEG